MYVLDLMVHVVHNIVQQVQGCDTCICVHGLNKDNDLRQMKKTNGHFHVRISIESCVVKNLPTFQIISIENFALVSELSKSHAGSR